MGTVLQRISSSSTEPVSLAQAKAHLRILDDAEDALISSLITVARETLEHELRLALLPQRWRYTLDSWPDYRRSPIFGAGGWCSDAMTLPIAPALPESVTISYRNAAGDTIELASSEHYTLEQDVYPSQRWPDDVATRRGSISVEFEAGWSAADSVPAALKQALLLQVGHLYANRDGESQSPPPSAITFLVAPWRWSVLP